MGLLLWKIRQVFAGFPREYQLLVLDDGSTDATAEVLEPYARVLPLTVIRHDERRGYAASVEELLRQAVELTDRPKRDAAILMHADFAHNPQIDPRSGAADRERRRHGGGRGEARGRAVPSPAAGPPATHRCCCAGVVTVPGVTRPGLRVRGLPAGRAAERHPEPARPAARRPRAGPPTPSCTGGPAATPGGSRPCRRSSGTICGSARAGCGRWTTARELWARPARAARRADPAGRRRARARREAERQAEAVLVIALAARARAAAGRPPPPVAAPPRLSLRRSARS